MNKVFLIAVLLTLTFLMDAAVPICRGSFKMKSGVWTSYEVFSHPGFLQFRVHCSEPDMKQLKCSGSVHDVSVWNGDSLELFIKPSKTGTTIAQIAVSPNGSTYDAIIRDQNRDPQWTPSGIKIKTARGKDFWSADIKIPIGVLVSILQNESERKSCGPDTWSFCLGRNRKAGQQESGGNTDSPWIAHEKYRKLKGVQAEYAAFRWNASGFKISGIRQQGKQFTALLEGVVDNTGGRMRIITITARLTDQKKNFSFLLAEQKLVLAKGQIFRLYEDVVIPRCGKFLLEACVSDSKGMILFNKSFPVHLEFIPIRLSIISGAYRGRDIFHSMPEKDLVFRVRTDYPVQLKDTCELTIRDAGHKVIVCKKLPAQDALKKNISVKLPYRKTGKYICEVKFSTKGLPTAKTTLRILPKVDNEIYLAENGNFVRNGKEFFPVGASGSFGRFAPEEFEKLCEFSLDCGPTGPVSQKKLAAHAEALRKYGTRSMPFPEPPELWSHYVSPEFAKRALRPFSPEETKRITQVLSGWKGSNFIFGWHLMDEPSEARCLPERYEQLAEICHEVDPYHMTYTTFNNSAVASVFGKSVDAAFIDFFPGFHEKGVARPLDYIARQAKETARRLGGGKSLISTPPLYAYVDNSHHIPRYATYAELRCMTYASLTEDSVRAISWNNAGRIGACIDNYIGIPRITCNLKALERFWLSRDLVKLSFTGKDASKLQWIAKNVKGKLYLLMVNPTDSALKISLKLPVGSGTLLELDSDKPQNLRGNMVNELSFVPFQVRIFSADPAAPKLITVEQVAKLIRDFEMRELKSGNLCYYKGGAETIYSFSYKKISNDFSVPANRRMVNDGLYGWTYNVSPASADPDPYLGIRFRLPEKVSRIEVTWDPLGSRKPDPSKLIPEGCGIDGKWGTLSIVSARTAAKGRFIRRIYTVKPVELKSLRFRFAVKDAPLMSISEIKAFK